jgi:hypothetical protein
LTELDGFVVLRLTGGRFAHSLRTRRLP